MTAEASALLRLRSSIAVEGKGSAKGNVLEAAPVWGCAFAASRRNLTCRGSETRANAVSVADKESILGN